VAFLVSSPSSGTPLSSAAIWMRSMSDNMARLRSTCTNRGQNRTQHHRAATQQNQSPQSQQSSQSPPQEQQPHIPHEGIMRNRHMTSTSVDSTHTTNAAAMTPPCTFGSSSESVARAAPMGVVVDILLLNNKGVSNVETSTQDAATQKVVNPQQGTSR